MTIIRRAVPADVARIVQVQREAFVTPIGKWMDGPAPDSLNVLGALKSHFSTLVRECREVYVACDETGHVVGYCCYCIRDKNTVETPSWLGNLESRLFDWQTVLANCFVYIKNWSLESERRRRIDSFHGGLYAQCRKTISDAGMDRHVYLQLLMIDPAAQGQGVGSKLLDLCMDEARTQNLPLVLESSARGFQFYLNKGFQEIGSPFELWDDGKLIGRIPIVVWHPPS